MPWECMFFTHAALPESFSLGKKQTGSTLRADTSHFYNCLQQERKHELNSSVVDGFGGERRMNCQQDGFCFYPGICCRSLCSGCPVQSPRIYRHSSQVWASLCGEVPGAGPASVEENLSGVSGREHSPQRGIWRSSHTSSFGGGSPARGSDLSEHPPTF